MFLVVWGFSADYCLRKIGAGYFREIVWEDQKLMTTDRER